MPDESPVIGRIPTEEFPTDIGDEGDVVISKYEQSILALTPVNATFPVFLIVAYCDDCVPYPKVADGNVMLDGLNVHSRISS